MIIPECSHIVSFCFRDDLSSINVLYSMVCKYFYLLCILLYMNDLLRMIMSEQEKIIKRFCLWAQIDTNIIGENKFGAPFIYAEVNMHKDTGTYRYLCTECIFPCADILTQGRLRSSPDTRSGSMCDARFTFALRNLTCAGRNDTQAPWSIHITFLIHMREI